MASELNKNDWKNRRKSWRINVWGWTLLKDWGRLQQDVQRHHQHFWKNENNSQPSESCVCNFARLRCWNWLWHQCERNHKQSQVGLDKLQSRQNRRRVPRHTQQYEVDFLRWKDELTTARISERVLLILHWKVSNAIRWISSCACPGVEQHDCATRREIRWQFDQEIPEVRSNRILGAQASQSYRLHANNWRWTQQFEQGRKKAHDLNNQPLKLRIELSDVGVRCEENCFT